MQSVASVGPAAFLIATMPSGPCVKDATTRREREDLLEDTFEGLELRTGHGSFCKFIRRRK